MIPLQPNQQINCLVGQPGKRSAAGLGFFQHQVDEGFDHQPLKFRAGGNLDVAGQARRKLIRIGIILALNGGDFFCSGSRNSSVNQAYRALTAFELLIEGEHVVGKQQFILHTILDDKAVVEKAVLRSPGLHTCQDLFDFRLFHPCVRAAADRRQGPVQALPVGFSHQFSLKPLQGKGIRERGHSRFFIQRRKLGLRVELFVGRIARTLQQHNVAARP